MNVHPLSLLVPGAGHYSRARWGVGTFLFVATTCTWLIVPEWAWWCHLAAAWHCGMDVRDVRQ